MYYLTISAGREDIYYRLPFQDYAEAVAACGEFYEPNFAGSILNFTSVVQQKKFLRSYSQLFQLDDLGDIPRDSPPAIAAVKNENAFSFSRSYTFLIESEEGILEAERRVREYDE